jgi:serine phosphatase RsbU (regulator of sigma subunit)
MDALAERGLKPVILTQDPLRAEEVAELGVEAILAGLDSRSSVAGVFKQDGITPQGLLPQILYIGVSDGAQRAELLADGAVCVFETSATPHEIALQTDAVVRQRQRLLEGTEELAESHDLLAQLQADLRLGARIQQSFLPPLSINTPAFSLEARIQASWTLSGDFFDYKFITPERLAVFIADISGHGVASALLASRLKAFFDEHYRNARRPARTLELLNHMLIELGEHQQFATAVLLCLDVSEGSLIYANAGHRTLYLLDREQGHYTPLASSGPALGLFEDCEMAERDFSFLPRRKRLVAYTDGLVEFKSHTHGEWVSEEEFIDQLILPNMHMPIAGFTDAVFSGSLRLSGGEKWDDDVCLVVVDC